MTRTRTAREDGTGARRHGHARAMLVRRLDASKSHPHMPRIRRRRHRAVTVAAPRTTEPRVAVLEDVGLRWINIEAPGRREIAWLDEEFPFHELDLEDVQSRRQRPKVDDYPDYLFVVLHWPWYDKESQRLFPAELNAFIGRDYLITLPNVPLKPVSNLFDDAPGGRREAGGDVRQGLRPPLLRGAGHPVRLLLPDPRAHRLEARRDRGRDLRGAHRDQRARHLERQAGDHRLPQDRQPAAPRAAAARPRHAPLPEPRTWRSTTTT